MKKNIITLIIPLLVVFLLVGCGSLFPNTAKITIVVDRDNIPEGFINNADGFYWLEGIKADTYDIFDVYFEHGEEKKADIKIGEEHSYDISWFGENQQSHKIHYYRKKKKSSGEEVKDYETASITVENFDNIKYHILWDKTKGPEIEYIK